MTKNMNNGKVEAFRTVVQEINSILQRLDKIEDELNLKDRGENQDDKKEPE